MRAELQLTFRCNLRCHGCDRLCDKFPERTEELSLDDVARFISQAKAAGGISRVKCCGGEPLLFSRLPEAYAMLTAALDAGILGSLVMQSNGTIKPLPVLPRHPKVSWKFSGPGKKQHIPYGWAPRDLGLPWSVCSHPRRCGFSFDAKGWLPCSPGVMIARLFGYENLYRQEIPKEVWGTELLCPLCSYGLPEEFRKQHVKKLAAFTEEELQLTESWRAALERAGVKMANSKVMG